jgi:hypothetical protein
MLLLASEIDTVSIGLCQVCYVIVFAGQTWFLRFASAF